MKKKYRIQLSDKAEKDFDEAYEAYEYYASISESAADKFYETVNDNLHTIKQSPETYQKFHKDVHRFVITNFPFIIYYQIRELIIRVIAIFHTSRNPENWQDRIEDEYKKKS
jgi:plasmid stabilization system protein ParE